MTNGERILQIRENERKSHISTYSQSKLFQDGTWLKKPVKTVTDLYPYFRDHTSLRVLDLGCGIGRNCIPIAKQFQHISCSVDCVDILDFAIEELKKYAAAHNVSRCIHGTVSSIEDFSILPNAYDWILAVSSLEHMDSRESFESKLFQIRNGLREGGILCLIINTDVREFDKTTGVCVPAQFELELSAADLQVMLQEAFREFRILKSTVRQQRYDIPRDWGISDLRTCVVTFAAKKSG